MVHALSRISQPKASFPENAFIQTADEILRIEQSCELIVVPLKKRIQFLYQVSRHGLVEQIRNFCAIGSGAYNAEAWLHFREQAPFTRLPETLLNVYEAKKFSEHAPGVGGTTRLLWIQGNDVRVLAKEKAVGKLWKSFGPRKHPKDDSQYLAPSEFMQWNWSDIQT